MSTLSSIAAALLLGLSIYAAVPIFTNDQEQQPPRTEIAFQALESTPDATAGTQEATTASATPSRDVPADVIYTGEEPVQGTDGTTFTPPIGTELTGVIGSDHRNPVSPAECVVDPMPREDAVKILSTSPADGVKHPNWNDDSSIDEATLGEVQATFREWQACRRFGNTYGAMALETDQFIRNDFYGPTPILGSMFPITTAYSESTLNELLDAREVMDQQSADLGAEKAKHNPGAEDGLNLNLWVIDTTTLPGDPANGTYATGDNGTYLSAKVVWTNPTVMSDRPFPTAYVTFQLVDGQWKVAEWHSVGNLPPVAD